MGDCKKKIIIIGGGIAGLSAGVYAKMSGFDVTVYEKNPVAGGECVGWNRKGLHIDNCIHWLTGSKKGTALYNVWTDIGALSDDTIYAPIKAFFASKDGDTEAVLWYDLDRTEKELSEQFPEDEKEIKRFAKYVRYAMCCQYPADKPQEMFNAIDGITTFFKLFNMIKVMIRYGNISLDEYSKRFKSPILRHMFTEYLPGCYTAYSFFVAYASMCDGNGDVPMGGSLKMVRRIIDKYVSLGGVLKTNSKVEQIIIKDGKATGIKLSDKEEVSADYIISAVDPKVLFGNLIDESYMPKLLKRAYADEEGYPVTSGFQVAFMADKGAFDGEMTFARVRELKVAKSAIDSLSLKTYEYDDTFNNGDKTVFQTIIWQTDKDYRYWKALSKEEYNMRKISVANEVMERLIEVYPNLKGHMEILDVWTPLTYERYCGAYHGSYMTQITTPHHKKIKLNGKVKGLDNVIMASQWVEAPGGLPMAVCSGKFAVQRILKKEGMSIYKWKE